MVDKLQERKLQLARKIAHRQLRHGDGNDNGYAAVSESELASSIRGSHQAVIETEVEGPSLEVFTTPTVLPADHGISAPTSSPHDDMNTGDPRARESESETYDPPGNRKDKISKLENGEGHSQAKQPNISTSPHG